MLAAAARPQMDNIGNLHALKNCGERALKGTMSSNSSAFVACSELIAEERAPRAHSSQKSLTAPIPAVQRALVATLVTFKVDGS